MKNLIRIIDANINRCCEGIRVIEDIFRFYHNNQSFSEKLKKIRHEIRNIFNTQNLITERDSEKDVGKSINSIYEFKRSNIEDILIANIKRVEEALRVIEEFLKLENELLSKKIKNYRFELYEIEKKFFSKKERFKTFIAEKKPLLYGIVDKRFSKYSHIETAKFLLDGGIKIIQLREKVLKDKDFLKNAIEIKKLCEKYDAFFIVNDRVDIAILSGADGVHLGQEDLNINDAKNLFGEDKIYGLSTHNLQQVKEAIEYKPDYIGFGPVFETKSKDNPDPVVGTELLKKVKEEYKNLIVVAIGGINFKNIKNVISCKPEMICVMSGIISQENIKETIKKYMEIIDDTIRVC